MRTANSVKLVIVLLLVCICSCQKDDKGSNNPSEEWYEIQIANGTWQYEKISDLSTLYKSYSFNENHSFVQYTKSAKRTKTTNSNGDVSYSKWEVASKPYLMVKHTFLRKIAAEQPLLFYLNIKNRL